MQVLVTDATGFIGRHLIERLVASRVHVRALVRSIEGVVWLEAHGVEVVRGDVGDASAAEQAAGGCNIIYHLATKTNSVGHLLQHDMRVTNVQGTENVAGSAKFAGVG